MIIMKKDTKVYSDFIKANKVKVTKDAFTYNGRIYSLFKENNGYTVMAPNGEQNPDGVFISKKSAIYHTIKFHG